MKKPKKTIRQQSSAFLHIVADPPPHHVRVLHVTVRPYAPVHFCGDILLHCSDGYTYFCQGGRDGAEGLAEALNDGFRRMYRQIDEAAANVKAVTQARALLYVDGYYW